MKVYLEDQKLLKTMVFIFDKGFYSPYFFTLFLPIFTKIFYERFRSFTYFMNGVRKMNDKFIDAMIDQSINMMNRACKGEKLSKDEINFILVTQRMSAKQDSNNILPKLLGEAANIFPKFIVGNGGQ